MGRFAFNPLSAKDYYQKTVIKSLASFALILVVLAFTAQACALPSTKQPAQGLAEVEATNVRRTAVADVQRIIANNPAATTTPEATAPARPTCADAIWWHEARLHIGEMRKVQGTIVAMRPAANGLALAEIGQPYPDPTGLAILIPASAAPALDGKTVCVAGRITSAEGRATMLVRNAASVVLVN
ncbi:MAG: hypothetical protein LC797_15385 [Chloroflexi bacterium]|nr:hypothetical protein [Chloroflexota bacterium]